MMRDDEWAMRRDMEFVLRNTSQEEKKELWHFYIAAVLALKRTPRVVAFALEKGFWKDARIDLKSAIEKWKWLLQARTHDEIESDQKTIVDIELFLNNRPEG